MVNLDDTISLIVFLSFFTVSIAYFSTLQSPNRVELEGLSSNVAEKLLTPRYLLWNVTKSGLFVNATSAQNLYPIDIRVAFPSSAKSNSVRVKYGDNRDVGFVYANTTSSEFVMLANLSSGKNIFNMFYSNTDASATSVPSDLASNGLQFSNSGLDGEFSSAGDIVSISYRNNDNPWIRDRLFIGSTRYEASSWTISQTALRLKYDFTNGSTTKTFNVYAFNPMIRVNVSTGNYTWNMRFAATMNRTFTSYDMPMNGSNSNVFSGATDFAGLYTSPGLTTTGIAIADNNMNVTIYDAAAYREINISNYTGSTYEMYYHHGAYTNGKPYGDLKVSSIPIRLAEETVSGIKASKITSLNATSYSDLKSLLGSQKDFNIQIENASDGALLLDYGKAPANFTDVVVHRRVENLLTADYDFQKVIVRVKTWN